MNIEERLRRLSADSQKKEAYKMGQHAFLYRMVLILIKQLEKSNPGIQRNILSELEEYAQETHKAPSLLQGQDFVELAQEMNLAVDACLEHLREELSE